MAARITDRQRKKIIADFLETESYNKTAKMNGISKDSVRRIVQNCDDFAEKAKLKKAENTADILAYMELKKQTVCEIIDKGLDELNNTDKLAAASPPQLTTMIGTLLDKWLPIRTNTFDTATEDDLSKSLKELAEELESDSSIKL